jgi:hypothetical protein
MEYLLTLEVRETGETENKNEAFADVVLVYGTNDFSSGTLVSQALQALIPGLLGEVYVKLDQMQRPASYTENME